MQLVETANGFSSKVAITNRSLTVDAKSIMSVMRLGAAQGIVLTIRAEGDDAEQAVAALAKLIEDGFGEMEGDANVVSLNE